MKSPIEIAAGRLWATPGARRRNVRPHRVERLGGSGLEWLQGGGAIELPSGYVKIAIENGPFIVDYLLIL